MPGGRRGASNVNKSSIENQIFHNRMSHSAHGPQSGVAKGGGLTSNEVSKFRRLVK